MCKATFYVGVDVGKDQLCVAVDGHKPRSFQHAPGGIKALYNWAGKLAGEAPLHFCMESTGVYSRSLAVRIGAFAGVEVSIVNPARIAAYARAQLRRTKTDGVDAAVILSFAQSQKPTPWKAEPEALRTLYHLVVQADALRATLRRCTNRGHAHKYIPDLPQTVSRTQKALRRCLEAQIAKIENAIESLCAQEPYIREAMGIMTSTVGIAAHSATRLLAYGGERLTALSAKALTAHAGLAPHHYQSGTSLNGKSRIAKQGDKRLRCALYMPTLVAIVYNPVIKHHYQKLLIKGKPKMLAVVACMRKLLLMIRSMLKNKKTFNPKLIPLT